MSGKPYEVKYYKNVKCRHVEWLWYPYIPYGKITIIQGDPGDGKSTFALNIAALVSNGEKFPFMKKNSPINAVVYQNNEDGKEDTICPRLKACGANLERIAYIEETDASLTLGDERLEKVLDETGARVLILDPIQAYFGNGTDMNRAGDIRPIMSRLSQMAAKRKCAVILIGHMSKGKNSNGLYRGLGSIDIPAAARSVLLISKMRDDSRERILAHIKSNLAPLGSSIIFRINENSTITWLNRSKLTARDVMENNFKDADDKLDKAKYIICELIKKKENRAKTILTACMSSGISKRTINTAKEQLGVESIKGKGGWYWIMDRDIEEDDDSNDE